MIALPAGTGFLRPAGASGPTPGVYKAAAQAVDQSGATATLSVPGSPVSGDYLLAILICRGDRTFTIPGGWTTKHDSGASDSTGTRYYVATKPYASESSVSFTQSTSAAFGFQLVLVSRDIGNSALTNYSAIITKLSSASDVIACILCFSSTDISGQNITRYTMRGTTSFFASPNYFYVGMVGTGSSVSAGSVSAIPSGIVGVGQMMFLGEILS